MARSIWTGSVVFGLVTIPVRLYSAIREHDVRFHQFAPDGSRIHYKRVSEETGRISIELDGRIEPVANADTLRARLAELLGTHPPRAMSERLATLFRTRPREAAPPSESTRA